MALACGKCIGTGYIRKADANGYPRVVECPYCDGEGQHV